MVMGFQSFISIRFSSPEKAEFPDMVVVMCVCLRRFCLNKSVVWDIC